MPLVRQRIQGGSDPERPEERRVLRKTIVEGLYAVEVSKLYNPMYVSYSEGPERTYLII